MALELPNGAKIVIDCSELIKKADEDIKKYGGHKLVFAVMQKYSQYPRVEYITHYYSPKEAFLVYDLPSHYSERIKQCTLTALRTKLEAQASYY